MTACVPTLINPERPQLVIRTHFGQESFKLGLVQNKTPLQY